MEIDYEALFGVGSSQGAEGQEVAEPAENQEAPADAGAEGQEVAEPAEADSQEQAVAETAARDQDWLNQEQAGQSAEENARYAAARRKAEQERDAAIERARADAQAEAKRVIDEAFQGSGLVNPYTKQPITSKAEFDAYKQAFEQDQRAKILKRSGMNEAQFDAFIQSIPEVRRAKEAETAANRARAEMKVEAQMAEIRKLNPNIQNVRDLAGMETYPKLYEMVQRGYDLADAYRLANFAELSKREAGAARQSAINAVKSKSHLAPVAERSGTAEIVVPEETKQLYRQLNPGVTDDEIKRHYAKSHKK